MEMETKACPGWIDGAALPDAAQPALPLPVPRRGVLAACVQIPWWWSWRFWEISASTTVRYVNASLLEPPGPPEAVIEARQFDCATCGKASFVANEQADRGVYIECPFCLKTSTSDPSATKCRAYFWLSTGIIILCLTIVMFTLRMTFADDVADEFHKRIFFYIFTLFTGLFNLRKGWTLFRLLPGSRLHAETVLYQLSITECTAVNPKTGALLVRVAVPPQLQEHQQNQHHQEHHHQQHQYQHHQQQHHHQQQQQGSATSPIMCGSGSPRSPAHQTGRSHSRGSRAGTPAGSARSSARAESRLASGGLASRKQTVELETIESNRVMQNRRNDKPPYFV